MVESKLLELEAELEANSHVQQGRDATIGDIDFDNRMPENNVNLVLRDPQVKKCKTRSKVKGKNVFGSKKQSKKSDQSLAKDRNVIAPDDENTTSVPKKRRGSSKRKG